MQDLARGGGTWRTYGVTAEQLASRAGLKVAREAPRLREWVRQRTQGYFDRT